MRSRTSLPLLLASALCSPLAAQTYETVPAGLLTTEADSYGLYFGSRADMRAQILTDVHTGKVRVFSQADLRRNGGSSASQAAGRSWSNVTLMLSEGKVAGASNTFTANLMTNTTAVFNQSVNWPTATTSAGTPSTWGTEATFPFSSKYIYSGAMDLVLDFTFTGGTLANSAAWTSYNYYYLDGVYSSTSVGGSSVNVGTNNCINPSHTSGPFCVPVLRTYAKNTGNTTTSDMFEFYWWLYRYPANTLTGFALDVGGSSAGVPIGNPCNNWHLNPSGAPLLIMLGVTPASNTGSFNFPTQKLYTKYDQNAVGLRVWTQAGYTHPTRNQFELTRAGYADVLKQPVPISGLTWTWTTSATSTTGNTPNQTYIPVIRLAY